MEKENKIWGEYKDQIKEALNDLKTKGKRHKQIPNILTLLRLTAPALIIPASIVGNLPFVLGSTIFFGLTDLADGFIARHWNLTSKLGADLDALADKIFAGTLLLAASVANPILLTNVGIEMAISGINLSQKAKGKPASSTLMGKVKTFSLFALAGAGILSSIISPAIFATLFLSTTVLQALTVKSYLNKYSRTVGQTKEKDEVQIEPTEIEEVPPVLVNAKEKQIEPKQDNSTIVSNSDVELEELKKMREFLTGESVPAKSQESKETAKVYKIGKRRK